ncbi:hypothetical protein L1987_52389 [Smallanthus sonchifolius]|uniref:Uncharacterized protein n=1 Tax=Smallanthus sonchifolius TaxID=185202 RepID=A0ACB9EU45_9ASTR|nr:hypothetical protein L1987_52389 [Smallanthus sonchifolius]
MERTQRKWRKVAYGGMQPGFDDNHTDDTFLQEMVMNANVVKRDMLKVMLDSVSISQYLCIVALVILVWTHTPNSTITENFLIVLDITLVGSGFFILLLTAKMLSLNLLLSYAIKILFFTMGLLHKLLFVVVLGVLVFVNLVCPYWLIKIQEYKFEINGPWDEAKLQILVLWEFLGPSVIHPPPLPQDDVFFVLHPF